MNHCRIPTAVIALLALLCIVSCAQPQALTILHTNDMHAGFLPHEAAWIQSVPKPMVGGFTELSWMVDSIRKAKGDVLLLDGGDVMTGTPISEFEYNGTPGGALFEMMNKIGYDAWTIGNHDLDISQENLRALTAIARFPTLSANLTDSSGKAVLNNREYVIVKKNGLRVGIIGLMTRDLFNVTNTNNLHGLAVGNAASVAQRIIDKIEPETDLIIALAHEGVEDDSALAATTHGLGVIIGAHSHTRLKVPKMVNGVIICQAGANGENLGELDLTVEGHKVTSHEGKLITLWQRNDRAKSELSMMVDSLRGRVDQEYAEVLGTLTEDWKRSRSGESNIGSFIADALREAGKADIGITNSSGIRKDLTAGNIRRLDLFEVSPFRNVLCTFRLSGKEVRELVGRYVQSVADGRTSIDLSGITCTWKRSGSGIAIASLKIGGNDIREEQEYLCATSDFLVNQSGKYLGMVPSDVLYNTMTIAQSLAAKVQRDKTVHGELVRRFQELR
jgi:2',3'-cyclic-nucleotide 2'-phosphodiesterase (5'-nucleotidase family)